MGNLFVFLTFGKGPQLQLLLNGDMCFKRDRVVCRATDIKGIIITETSGYICAPKNCWNKECEEIGEDGSEETKITYKTYDCTKGDPFPIAWAVILPLFIGALSTFCIYKSGICKFRSNRRRRQE